MVLSKKTACLALIVAVIAYVAKFHVHLFLRIPGLGFYPYAIFGGSVPPWLDYASLAEENAPRWLHDGDVVMCTTPGAGSIWVHYMILLLRFQGRDVTYDLTHAIGTPEMVTYPGQTLEERLQRIENLRAHDAEYGVRNLQHWTNRGFDGTPATAAVNPRAHPNVNYIFIVRDGESAVQSVFNLVEGVSQGIRDMMGGFPPKSTKADAIRMWAVEYPEFYFGLVKEWWAVHNEPNVYLTNFFEIARDHRAFIESIAAFLEIDVSPEMLDRIAEMASGKVITDPAFVNRTLFRLGFPNGPMHLLSDVPAMPRGWIKPNFFTEEEKAMWQRAEEENFNFIGDEELRDWYYRAVPRE